MNTTPTTTLSRTEYGVLYQAGNATTADVEMLDAALRLADMAADAGKIPAAIDDMAWGRTGKERGHRIGTATLHEVYDLTPSAALICVRETEGTRYGIKTLGKAYFVITKCGRGVRVSPANKAIAAKAAKAAGSTLGTAIAVCQGKKPLPAPACAAIRVGYKIVRREGEGYISVWDDSPWTLGALRTEAATPDHTGGFYFYATLDTAVAQVAARETFGDLREYDRLAILECEVSGREFENHAKKCATRVRPVREVFTFI